MSSKTKTTATKEDAKPPLVPKLRFPEFRDGECWDADALGDVANFVNEKVPLELVALENYVSTENILPDYGGVAKASKLPTVGSVTRYRPNDTLVSNIRPYLKKVWVADKEGGASNDVIVIRAKQSLLPQYLSCLLKNDAFIDYVMTGAKGVKMPRGDVGSMKAYPTLYPSKAEQQKIAECLSSVDELMAAQARKLEALKTHKKGLMQQLFPREGETQPRLRFPEFQNAGEWEKKRVDELGDVLAGKALAVNAPSPLRPYLRTKNVSDGAIDLSDVLTMPMTDAEFSRFEILYGDILLNEGQSLELVGRASIYRGEFGGRCAMQNQLLRFRAFRSTCPEFAEQTFRRCQRDGTFADVATKTTSIAHLGSSRFSALALAWPPTLPEQQRIADCLTSLDDLIAAQTQKHEALKTHKKGLMEQLFPSPEERS